MAQFIARLTADVLQPDQVIHVDSNVGARTTYPWRLVIEDEVMYVLSGVVGGEESGVTTDGLTWTVHRGADDTDPAIHLAGTFITAVAVGEFTTEVPLFEDGVTPAAVLTIEDGSDWLTSDPEPAGV